ncbi:geranylgeranyl pyrophosphate synthetase [Colletotrichum sojae]|uniref:Geranylgeranyl pyrophosphate synthetase n=1 Tax=Colletotrichum sojae TaxID=2175907 RepID=A0A8H6MN68_9PEZI|nr:geranylgeranyl pyrophosphate synthetase [Colletotrichum sojae]
MARRNRRNKKRKADDGNDPSLGAAEPKRVKQGDTPGHGFDTPITTAQDAANTSSSEGRSNDAVASSHRAFDDRHDGVPDATHADPSQPLSSTAGPSSASPTPSTPSASSQNPSNTPKRRSKLKDHWLYKDTGKHGKQVATVSRNSIQQLPKTSQISSAEGTSVLCSYNWLNDERATVFVPGGAANWNPPECPVVVSPDEGQYYIDQNAAKNPSMPFEPMFAAMAVMSPNIDLTDVNVIVNRNTLRNLFRFAKGQVRDSFKIQMHMVRDTLFISRREKTTSYDTNDRHPSWGHAFEHSFTQFGQDLERSTSHHRAIQYNLGGLKLIVRHEVDAAYEETSPPTVAEGFSSTPSVGGGNLSPQAAKENKAEDSKRESGETTDDAAKRNLGEPDQIPDETKVLRTGNGTSPSNLSEVKASPKIKLRDVMDQLWFGRTPRLIICRHNRGTFHEAEIHDCESKFAEWEQRNQATLQELVKILTSLRQEVTKIEGKRAIGVCDTERGKKNIQVWTCVQADAPIPVKYIERHWPDSKTKAPSDEWKAAQHGQAQEATERGPQT